MQALQVRFVHRQLPHLRLSSIPGGGYEIISLLRHSPLTKYLILGHNPLGDDGTAVLFQYLCSPSARQTLAICEISLNSCQVGNLGLYAIAQYLHGNIVLRSLFLQNVSYISLVRNTTVIAPI